MSYFLYPQCCGFVLVFLPSSSSGCDEQVQPPAGVRQQQSGEQYLEEWFLFQKVGLVKTPIKFRVKYGHNLGF